MPAPERDYYEVLQVDPRAEPEVIHAAYRRLAAKYHPDVNRTPEAAERMKELNAAFTVLGNPERRREYDAIRRARMPATSAPPQYSAAPPSSTPRSIAQGLLTWIVATMIVTLILSMIPPLKPFAVGLAPVIVALWFIFGSSTFSNRA